MSRRLALLVNPAAAGGRTLAVLPEVRSELERLGTEHRVVRTTSLDHARGEAAAAADAGETVVGMGGDGLIGRLAGELRGHRGPLAMIPAGRGNDFARALGVPFGPGAAARVAAEGVERDVDVAEVNGAPFVGVASLGFDSAVQDVANRTKLIRGELVYAYAAVRALAAWRHATFDVAVDGRRQRITGFSAAVGNSGVFGGGMWLMPHARIDDGRLDVLCVERQSKLRYLRGLPKVFEGAHVDSPYVHLSEGESVEIRADRPFVVYADGDPIAKLPAAVRVEPRSLRVLVPPPG